MLQNESDIGFSQRMGMRIRCFREQCGFSPEKLVVRVGGGITTQLLHDYEMGLKPVPACYIGRLADALGVLPYLLLNDLPFANAADWHLSHNYRGLSVETQRCIRRLVKQLIEDTAVFEP